MTEWSKSRKGDLAEYYAVTWLWDQGFEVFKNAGCDGCIDIVAISPEGDTILIDVKTLIPQQRSSGGVVKRVGLGVSDKQKALGVHYLGFDPEDRSLRFIEHSHETTYSRYRDKQQAQYDLDLCDSGC